MSKSIAMIMCVGLICSSGITASAFDTVRIERIKAQGEGENMKGRIYAFDNIDREWHLWERITRAYSGFRC